MEGSDTPEEYKSKFQEISSKSVEEKILNHFVFLKEEDKFVKFYSQFDIEEENKMIINMWEQIINYIYEEIFNCMFLTISDLKKSITIKNQFPFNFQMILQYLIYNKKYIIQSDLKNDYFYNINFPYLYPQKSFFSGFNLWKPLSFCKSDNDNNDENNNDNNFEEDEDEIPTRKDLGKNYSYVKIPDNCLIINYKIFKGHCNQIIYILKDILSDEGEEIILKDKFIEIIKKDYLDISLDNRKFKLIYKLQLLDEALYYLKQTKQIIIFKIDYFEFIKATKDNNDSVNEEDKDKAKSLLDEYNKNV